VGTLLQERLQVADPLLETAILRVGLPVEPVTVPQLPSALHHAVHADLEGGEQRKEPSLKE
jgi:hypothetical protein